jgi:phosphopentomutase
MWTKLERFLMVENFKRLGAQFLAAFGAAGVDHAATTNGCHARAETMTAGADDFTGLVCSFHGIILEPELYQFEWAALIMGSAAHVNRKRRKRKIIILQCTNW